MTDETKRKQLSKADYKKMFEDERALNEKLVAGKATEGNLDHQIQYRETEGIYGAIKFRADADRLSVNEYVKKVMRAALGYH